MSLKNIAKMKTDGKKIDALIFDLGGVLIDLDLEKCKRAFAERLSYNGIDMLLDAFHQKGIYSDLEEGLISADEFRSRILAGSAPGCTAEDVDEAVFALLVGVRPYKFALLTELAKSYDLYLLSNTNPISMIKCYRLFEEAGYPMDRMFRKLFLSYQMKMQKPSERIFRTAVEETGCTPDRVLFIDDSAANVEGAEKAGLNAMLFNQKDNLETALKMKLEELGQC